VSEVLHGRLLISRRPKNQGTVHTCTTSDIRNVGVDLTIGESRVVGVTEKRY